MTTKYIDTKNADNSCSSHKNLQFFIYHKDCFFLNIVIEH